MKKRILIGIFTIIIFMLMLMPSSALASAYSEYTIKSYNIDMKVNEDNTFDIVENITVNFNVAKHGIFRKIPLKNEVKRQDGTISKNKAKISNIKVNESYSSYIENGYKVIKIGDADTTLTGIHSYTIQYKYNIGKDPLEDADELYFNLIGNQWDTSIEEVNFNITMPKSFDESLLGFTTGTYGSTDYNVNYIVYDNNIKGNTTKTLMAGEGLTVRLTLPEGYFIEDNSIDILSILAIIMSVSFVVISFGLWAKYGKDDKVIETVEFYPPDGYNSAEIGYMYHGSANTESVISLLIYLANKGYLKIEEIESSKLLSKSKGFRITKLKDYDGNNESERLFLEGLFKSKDSVTKSDLYDKFYTTLDKIKSKLSSRENRNKIFESVANRKMIYLFLMVMAIILMTAIRPVIEYGEQDSWILALVFPAIAYIVLILSVMGIQAKAMKFMALIWVIGFGAIPSIGVIIPAVVEEPIYLLTFIIGLICIVIITIFIIIMPKRTKFGTEMLGKLKGFKRFLETAEKNQLESLVEQDPEYFYNILPYTYALGVSDKWMKQFETIAMEAPTWYYGYHTFNMYDFNHFMNSTMTSAQSAMSSSPSSSGSGGFSGGGFSGGGSGGGGGGSW